MAAIVYALTNAKHLTYGANNIRVYTDHQPLIGVGKKCFDDIDNPRIAKMFELICHYNFELVHIPGKENIPADVLSQLDHTTREMPDIASHIPARAIRAVQTRKSTNVTKDLEEIAIRGQED